MKDVAFSSRLLRCLMPTTSSWASMPCSTSRRGSRSAPGRKQHLLLPKGSEVGQSQNLENWASHQFADQHSNLIWSLRNKGKTLREICEVLERCRHHHCPRRCSTQSRSPESFVVLLRLLPDETSTLASLMSMAPTAAAHHHHQVPTAARRPTTQVTTTNKGRRSPFLVCLMEMLFPLPTTPTQVRCLNRQAQPLVVNNQSSAPQQQSCGGVIARMGLGVILGGVAGRYARSSHTVLGTTIGAAAGSLIGRAT